MSIISMAEVSASIFSPSSQGDDAGREAPPWTSARGEDPRPAASPELVLLPEPAAPVPTPATSALPAASAAAIAATLLAACGGGDGESVGAVGHSLVASSLTAVLPTRVEAARFLLQAQFSASDVEIAAVQSLGYAAWLELQFVALPSISAWDWLISKGYNDPGQIYNPYPINFMAWHQVMGSADAVRTRVALAFSEIFVVGGEGVAASERPLFAMAAYWDTLASHAFGTYRQLLEAVTLNPAMGVYLNTRGNQKADLASGRAPDENYGREVMQLFSIGLVELNLDGTPRLGGNGLPIETYTQETVTQIASMFTGWDFDPTGASIANPLQVRNPMRLTSALHSDTGASFLGVTIPAGTDGTTALSMTLDALANHPNVGPFIGKQLIQRLVTSNPSPAYVARVATAFNNNGAGVRGDLKAVLRAVLLDDEARDSANLGVATWGRLREPMLRLVQWARTFNATSASGYWQAGDTSSTAYGLGQSPLESPSVFNYFRPGYVPPDSALAGAGHVAPEFQIVNESTVASYINFMANTIPWGFFDIQANYATEIALASNPDALLDRVHVLLAAGQLDAPTLDMIRAAIASISDSSSWGLQNRVWAAILLVMASPQYLVQK